MLGTKLQDQKDFQIILPAKKQRDSNTITSDIIILKTAASQARLGIFIWKTIDHLQYQNITQL